MSTSTAVRGNINTLRIVKDNRPHWKRGGPGWIELRADACPDGWVQIDTTEQAIAHLGTAGSQKRTMLTLDLAEARQLRDLINYALGEEG